MEQNDKNKLEEIKKIIETELANKSLEEFLYKYSANYPHSEKGPDDATDENSNDTNFE